MSDIPALLIEQGRELAAQRLASGQIWGNAVQNLAQLPGQVYAQRLAAAKEQAQIARENALDTRDAQRLKIDQQRLDAETDAKNRTQAATEAQRIWQASGTNGEPDPSAVQDWIKQRTGSFWKPEEADQLSAIAAQPGGARHILTVLGGTPPKPDLMLVPEGGSVIDKNAPTGGPVFSGAPKPEKPTEADLALKAAGGDLNAQAALKLLKPEKPETGSQEDARYEDITTRQSLGQSVSPMEKAWKSAYERRKTLGPEATAAAAADRQAATIAQQNQLQQSNQQFQVQQAGRKELSEKVEQPYQTALASAQTLRDTVAAARAGNLTAANLQALETTIAAIRAQGLNRINTTELGVGANAGSLWDRLQGSFGKLTAGQPVDAKIQKDMEDFAGILEKGAYKKYSQGFYSTTKRYGLKDEVKAVEPGGATKIIVTAPDGSQHPFDTQAQADAFKKLAGIK